MQKVVVVILNYKVADFTIKCLKSVLNSTHKSLEVVIVDNNSKDNLEEKISKYRTYFIQTGSNLGYAGGNNVGIKKALEKEANFVFILNPDTTVLRDAIGNLVLGMVKNDTEIANPKIYFSQSKKIWFAGKIFDRANVLASHKGVDEIDLGQFDKEEELNDLTGAALMIKREVFEKIGFFDERYFMYYEDTDFAYRAHLAGFKMFFIPSAIVYHNVAKSAGLGSPLQDYFITRNRMLFAKKFLPLRTQLALLREAWRNRNIPSRKLAMTDFLMGKFGKGSFVND